MPEYAIEREIPGAGNLSDSELREIARKSVGILKEMGPDIKWLRSYVTGDKVYCVYLAPDEEAIREHGRRGGFPVNRVSTVRRMIDPTALRNEAGAVLIMMGHLSRQVLPGSRRPSTSPTLPTRLPGRHCS